MGQDKSFTAEFFTYTPGTPPYEPLAPPARVPRIWGVEMGPRTSVGRRGARGDGLVESRCGVLGVVGGGGGVAARRRGAPAVGREGVPHVSV